MIARQDAVCGPSRREAVPYTGHTHGPPQEHFRTTLRSLLQRLLWHTFVPGPLEVFDAAALNG